jgi:hypothetical protein
MAYAHFLSYPGLRRKNMNNIAIRLLILTFLVLPFPMVAQNVTLKFDSLPVGPFTNGAEAGFTITATGTGPSIWNGFGVGETNAIGDEVEAGVSTFTFTKTRVGNFWFVSVDSFSFDGSLTLTVNGYLGVALVGTETYATTDTYLTYSATPQLAGKNIDRLEIIFQNSASASVLSDNLVLNPSPTAVNLVSFTGKAVANHVALQWETASELDNGGFHLWRSTKKDGVYDRITGFIIPAQGGPSWGAEYIWRDFKIMPDTTYYYKLEDIDYSGHTTFHGPIEVQPLRLK